MVPIHEIISGLNARLLGGDSSSLVGDADADGGAVSRRNGCMCQRWNAETNDWGPVSPFWKKETNIKLIDLIVFNFPHSEQAGRATKLVQALFKQVRTCIDHERVSPAIVVEMRLRIQARQTHIRSLYKHEETAELTNFKLVGCWDSDLEHWESLGYCHKWTKKNETCRDLVQNCQVWRWMPVEACTKG
mmetsp:Transcript_14101/g.18389  ORF Transcript_14101/g.18389 Transcript_14101/m.18389 type:complete len:189 (-) Transcript_14101:17-583(-)